MTIRDFFESNGDLAIHCNTIGKAEKLLKAFDREGYQWNSEEKYTDATYWDRYKEYTCYSNHYGYGGKEYYRAFGYAIIEFEDMKLEQDLSQYTIDELLEEIKRRIKE